MQLPAAIASKRRLEVAIPGLLAVVSLLVRAEVRSGYFCATLLNNSLLRSEALQHWLRDAAAARLLPPEAGSSQGSFGDVPAVPFRECTPQALARLSAGGTAPVIVRGAHAESRILRWDVGRLLELFGNEASLALERRIDPKQPDVTFGERLRMYQRGEIRQVNQVFFARRHRRLRELLGRELGGALAQGCAGHGGGLEVPAIAVTVNVYRAYANQSSGVAWHAHNLEAPSTIHVRGRKTWSLVAPRFTPLLRPRPSLWGAVTFVEGNPYSYVGWDPMSHMQPMISRIPVQRVTADAGDVLFVPAGWWHNTENERADSDVISLVFSHISAGATLARTHTPYALLSWANLVHVAGIEAVEYAKWLTSLLWDGLA